MPCVEVNGINLYYEQNGQGKDLILICGFGSNLTRWKELIPILSKHYRVTLFDNRGSGRTDSPSPPYSIEMMAKDTADLMDALRIPYGYILGHSMGSAIVQQLCLDHSTKVIKALLLNSFSHLPASVFLQLDITAKLIEAEIDFELILQTVLPWLFGNEFLSEPRNVKKALNNFLSDPFPQSQIGFGGQHIALKHFDSRKRLKEITTSTLILAGELDLYTPASYSENLHAAIPNSEICIFKGAGHMIPDETPLELIKYMTQFFS